ncbi:SDR family NAD(P)-dependent oxidoreductase [Pontibacter silvestris]|uniref:SDR family NAD(P)-dependent oxidoreductase n=1 Tax=Pontibacter silvestris TaxID=2305183 RepID=A0ABW4X4I2_9BACT|nr:SDR family NAD(P)-dependent oxidoreductase [Pontibacter silvestris]MCC9135007.1 SDR family NAD(P)-dependent oxidoreductase [Pontibacter silvestris]
MKKAKDTNKLWYLAAGAGALLAARAISRKLNAYNFKGKVVLITGGSRGLGLVMARQLAEEGARLVLCARNNEELERARKELADNGADVMVQVCDVTVEQEVNAMVKSILNEFGQIDVLVNNAGVIHAGPVTEMTTKEFKEANDIYYWAPVYTTLAVLPGMKDRGEGRILNIASIGGKISVPHLVPYSANKFALVGLSEGLRAELKEYNITVTTANPGLMQTGSPRQALVKGHHKEEYALFKLMGSNPLTSTTAESSAKSILNALRHGDAEVITTLPAKLGAMLHNLSPELMTEILGLVNMVLPGEGGIGKDRAKGYQSESPLSMSPLTKRTQKAAKQNNEF